MGRLTKKQRAQKAWRRAYEKIMEGCDRETAKRIIETTSIIHGDAQNINDIKEEFYRKALKEYQSSTEVAFRNSLIKRVHDTLGHVYAFKISQTSKTRTWK